MKHNDDNLKYSDAVVSFAATALQLECMFCDYRVVNFAKSTMDGIAKIIDRFVAENPLSQEYIECHSDAEFGAYLAFDLGGYGDGFDVKELSDAAYQIHVQRIVPSLDVVEGDDGWLHIEALDVL